MLSTTDPARLLYVSGVPDLNLPGRTVHPLDDVATWPDTVPDGALVVIDEVQRVWRPKPSGQPIPREISELETHRHRGIDFVIITQAPGLVHKNVRQLVGRHVHLRDVGMLGRWWYEWPEVAENCLTGWKNAPIKRRYRLPRRVFGLYRSASMHVKPSRSLPMMAVVGVVATVAALAIGISAYRNIVARSTEPEKPAPTASAGQVGHTTTLTQAPTYQTTSAAHEKRLIDDRIDWIPRVSTRPESAPAYDELRRVQAMPVVVGGYCAKRGCRCYTQQATDAGLSADDCRRWIENPPFDPYTAEYWPSVPPPPVMQPEEGKEPEKPMFRVGKGRGSEEPGNRENDHG
ncbi:MAG: zonular occludens toxin domain-containing protein [Lautropia sp.]|nr:zonular occludens toxin domain-containing protein [Lautropia sp.]